MSANKAALKAAKAALDAHKYEDAAKEAQKVLNGDPKHYHANVFLGLALERSNNFEEAENVYNLAIQTKGDDPLVWQGLINLYEKQANKKIDEYGLAARKLSAIYLHADDKYRCQVTVDKYVDFAKTHGTKDQYRLALELLIPSSHVYDYLEGRLPHPSQTYSKIAEIIEAEEKQRINKLIGERRTRLGAKIGQVTNEVKREVYSASPLEELYNHVINWTNDDDTRRLYEEKLLQRAFDTLAVLNPQEKPVKRSHVQKLAEGLVILRHAFPLAWNIVIEWKDVQNIRQIDKNLLLDFMEIFPEDGLTKVLKGYLSSILSPFQVPVQEEGSNGVNEQSTNDSGEGHEDDESHVSPIPNTSEDRLILMSEGLEQSSRSVLSHRLMGDYLLHLEEFAAVVDIARKMEELINIERQVSGLGLQDNMDTANTLLGTSLIKFQSPRHHTAARLLFDSILQRKPKDTSALIGIGLILEEEEEYDKAADFLSRALHEGAGIKVKAEAAWCKALANDYAGGLKDLETCLEEIEAQDVEKNLKAEVLYRIGICMWNLDSSKAARKDRTRSYASFIASLQANLNYAPAYTSLGVYYSDYTRDKKRARKCFQKAFELSPSEVEAAQRLARAFAEQSDWELVEVVAQRVVDSGKVRPPPGSKKKGLSWPFAALGVCQLNNQDYVKSVVSFQSALRTSPADVNSWIGLGESYHNSGRYIAATKAFEQAQKLQDENQAESVEDRWFSKYMLGNVRRELGDFEEAVSGYRSVLELKPFEYGVSVALLQTYVEAAWQNIQLGLYGNAAVNAVEAIRAIQTVVGHKSDTFNLWRALGDACSTFSYIEAYCDRFPVKEVRTILQASSDGNAYETLSDIDGLRISDFEADSVQADPPVTAIYASILAHKRAVFVSASDIHAQAVAWYNLGWVEYRACTIISRLSVSFPAKAAMPYLKASVRCFKRAIELEAGNAEFWNALGLATSVLNPKVAQHAFVRSLYINDKSARVWTNLGAFYLLQNDTELANEAFTRGQSSDPDYANAWIGQGLLALFMGEKKEAASLFTHAFEISDSSLVVTKRLYAASAFDEALRLGNSLSDIIELIQPLFALHQLKSQLSGDDTSLQLTALIAERVGEHAEPVELLIPICEHLEAEYEHSESTEILARFAQAKSDLARAFLASGNLLEAIENAGTALDLSAEDDLGNTDNETRAKYRLSSHLTCGLAANYSGDMDKAITMFRAALKDSSEDADIICILAQVLWTKGGNEEQNNARELLFNCIERNPTHADAIILLAVISVLDDDQDTLEAVESDLSGLRSRSELDAQQKLRIGKLLAGIALLKPESTRGVAQRADATSTVMLNPYQPHGWSQLAEIAGKDNENPREMALLAALGSAPPKAKLNAMELSEAYAGTSRIADAQRSIAMAPWLACGWESLKD